MSLATSLTGLGLDHRLTWVEVEELIEQAAADADQAVCDAEFDAWWNGHVMWTRQRMAFIQLLDKLLEPRRVA